VKALKYHGAWELELQEVPDLHVTGPDDVVVEIRFCGICGTDVGIVSGSYPVAVPGVTIGHEAGGIVVEVGPEVTNVEVGDKVVIDPTPYCGTCRMCRTGRTNHCANKMGTESGVSYDGAFASRYRTTSAFVYRLPEHVTLEQATLTEPLSCVLGGIHQIHPPTLAANTFVFGAGPLGLLYTWALWLRGLTPVVVERSPERLKFAAGCLPENVGIHCDLQSAREGRFGDAKAPIDVAVDTTSVLLEELYPQIACGGTYLSVGLKSRQFNLDGMLLADRSLSILGSIDSRSGSFQESFHLIVSGRIPVEKMVSHVLPLEEYRSGFAEIGCDIQARSTVPIVSPSCKVLLAPEEAR
jgi:L-iditol 2-dehydrogenase